jgi:hypothetical protein
MDTSDWAKNLAERKKKELQEERVKDDKLDAQLDTKWTEVDGSVPGGAEGH